MFGIFRYQNKFKTQTSVFKKELNCSNIGRMPIITSVLLCCSNGKMCVLQMGSHTPLQDEGETLMVDLVKGSVYPIRIQRPEVRDTSTETETDSCQC